MISSDSATVSPETRFRCQENNPYPALIVFGMLQKQEPHLAVALGTQILSFTVDPSTAVNRLKRRSCRSGRRQKRPLLDYRRREKSFRRDFPKY